MPHFTISLSLCMLLVLPLSSWALEPDAQVSKDRGMQDFNLGYLVDAVPHLEVAAEAGDAEAMYYLGEAIYQTHLGYTTEAVNWYAQAAQRGDSFAMLRLHQSMACELGEREAWCPGDAESWEQAIEAQELPKAETGDSEAMLVLHYLNYINSNSHQAEQWLEKAAEAGNPEAQNLLGKKIRAEDVGWYWTENGRWEAAEAWFRKAAEQGQVSAMSNLAEILSRQDRFKEAWEWIVKASDMGHSDARLTLAACYLEPDENSICQVDKDAVSGWAILEAMDTEAPNHMSVERAMRLRQDLVSPREQEEAKVIAKDEWLNRKPPLSDYPDRYDPNT